MARNSSPKDRARVNPKNDQQRALSVGKASLPKAAKGTFNKWDGSKYVEIPPEELLRIERMNFAQRAKLETNNKTKNRDNLQSDPQERIAQEVISSLRQIGNPDALQKVFDRVASDLGLTTTPRPDAAGLGDPTAAELALPISAPESYRDRPDRREYASEFLQRVYQPWLEAGTIFQFQIGKLDPQLLQGLKNQFKGRADELRALLPHKFDAVSARLTELVGNEVTDPVARRRLVQAERSMASTIKKFRIYIK